MKQTKNIVLIAATFIIIVLLLKYCKGGGGTVESVKIDTVWVKVKADTFYIPKTDTTIIEKTKYKLHEVVRENFDTLWLPELIDVDTLQILADYYKSNIYKDTIRNQYGYIAITDTINQNKISGRKASTNLSIPEVTKTITILDKRTQLYASFGLLGNSKELAAGASFGFTLKTKNDRMIELGYNKIFNGQGYYELGYKHKISLRKK